jgi:(1->4)-alpha-D-glucan 1-alpha-D-glucosylmutase
MRRTIASTYRLQVTREFPISSVTALVGYFDDLGVSHLYLSPLLAARAGTTHGYDVVDHTRLNPELGTETELYALAAALHARQMGIVLDIVPNHMAAVAENPFWDDLLERGKSSRYAEWFDVDWEAPGADGKVVLPVLGDELQAVVARGELRLHIRDTGARIAYADATFPLDPATLPKELLLAQWDPAAMDAAEEWAAGGEGRARMGALLDAQHYRLTFWRRAAAEANYRRFFDVNDLVALRMESEEVFDATHALILKWVREGILDGLRVDHVDGLRVPSWYLGKLRSTVDAMQHADAPERFPLVVEKILSGDERLPNEWPVDGTTGYDFMNEIEEIFLDPAGVRAIEHEYRAQRRNPALRFAELAREGKRRILNESLAPDVARVARLAHAWRADETVEAYAAAIVEVIAQLDVYRTYVSEPGLVSDADRRVITTAFTRARECAHANDRALTLLESAFLAAPSAGDTLRADLVMRFQQTSGPAMAKGVEDTALYVYVPLVSRNEVGGDPDRPLDGAQQRAHASNAARQRDWPRTMLATNTHDTKRSADLRSRLDVLTTMPDEWARYVTRWRRLNRSHKQVVDGRPSPDPNTEYLYYQTLLGIWPAPRRERRADDLPGRDWRARARERLLAYMLKAAREAKLRTSWTENDVQYEKALDTFVRATLEPSEDAPFLSDVARLTALVADNGFRTALARLVLHCTSPGVPDVYQGDELWNFTLVDPDNRRPVDYSSRAALLETTAPETLRPALSGESPLSDDRVKMAFTARLLRFRREHVTLLTAGDYLPLLIGPADPNDLFAYARRVGDAACITLARTRPLRPGKQEATAVALPDELAGEWHSVLTGRVIEMARRGPQLTVDLSDLIPVSQSTELLLRTNG